jgi:phosphoglycolate phosphatase
MNVLLDLDGTLTDPREGILQCIKHALIGLGEPCPSDAELEGYIGPPLQSSFGAAFGPGSPKIAKAIDLYRERFSTKGIFENTLYPEIPSALRALKDLGAMLVVATSKPTVFAHRIVEHFCLGSHISAVYGSELDGTRSDKTELISHILKAESIPPTATFMVGDRAHDMIGAKANGIAGIGALWGYGSRQELISGGAAALCHRPSELDKVLSSNSALLTDACPTALRALSGAAKRER